MEKALQNGPIIVVQARMDSIRLPGKVLRQAAGKPMLGYTLDRMSRVSARLPVVVATSDAATDDPVAAFCADYGVSCVRGPLDDVAARFLKVLDETGARAFVRISGDSPLLDPALVDRAADLFEKSGADLVTNVQQRTFPKGMSVELVDAAAFRRAIAQMDGAEDREHVTHVFYRAPAMWDVVAFESGRALGDINLSVDTADDFARFETILARMSKPHWHYDLDGILALSAAPVGASG